ncbi:MAG: tail fiber domain-containing protein, partial [Candidatus Margulisiibacteriota bacterium]
LATDMTAADASTLTIAGNESFAVNDILRIKDDTYDEWFEVTNIGSAPTYTVIRDKAAAYGANANPAWPKGAAVVNYGASGKGGLFLTSSETNAPYMQVFTHAGSPWTTITTRAKFGNLNGSYGYVAETYGMAAGVYGAASNTWISVDATNGIRIGNNTTVIGQWDAAGNVLIGKTGAGQSNVYITSGAVQLRNNVTSIITLSSTGVAAIAINTGGNITLSDGGDIILQGDNATPSMVIWKDGAAVIDNLAARVSGTYAATGFWPETDNTRIFTLGWDITGDALKRYTSGHLYFSTGVHLYAYTDSQNYAQVSVFVDSGDHRCRLRVSEANVTYNLQFGLWGSAWALRPDTANIVDIGETTARFRNLFLSGYAQITDYLCAEGGIHVGGTSDPAGILYVSTNIINYPVYIYNAYGDGSHGIEIRTGKADGTGTINYIRGEDGNGIITGYLQDNNGTFGTVQVSSEKLKKNVRPTIQTGLDIICALKIRDFELIKNNSTKTSFVAEEVDLIYPDAVSWAKNGEVSGIMRDQFVIPLVLAVQEIKADYILPINDRVKKLEEEIELLKKVA